MSANFQVEFSKNNGDLHVMPRGDLDGSSSWELVNLLHEHYDGNGQVIIDTQNLRELCPFGCNTFQCRLNHHHVPPDRLLFKGVKGHELAPDGSKIIDAIEPHHCKCNGRCKNCHCKGGHHHH